MDADTATLLRAGCADYRDCFIREFEVDCENRTEKTVVVGCEKVL